VKILKGEGGKTEIESRILDEGEREECWGEPKKTPSWGGNGGFVRAARGNFLGMGGNACEGKNMLEKKRYNKSNREEGV